MGIAEILGLIGAAQKIIDFIARQKRIAEQSGAWTAAERAQVDARWTELTSGHAWQTDEEGGNI